LKEILIDWLVLQVWRLPNKPGGTSFNPLLIYGGVGLGKTHLAHAIGVDIKDKYPDKTVLYISSEKFTQLIYRLCKIEY